MTLAVRWFLMIAVGSMGAPAWAADGSNAVVATAPPAVAAAGAAPAADQTGAQISAWMHENDDGSTETGSGYEPAQPPPRQVHGEVSVGIGTSGYRSVSGIADIPVGRSSDLVVAASRDTLQARGYGGTNQSLSVGLFLNGASPTHRPCAPRDRLQAYGGPGMPPEAAPLGGIDCRPAGGGGDGPA